MKKSITTIAMLVFMTISVAFGQNLSGIYYGEFEGTKVACELKQQGSQLAGILQDDAGNTFEFYTMLSQGSAKGKMIINGMYETPYMASFSASACTFNISGIGGVSIKVSLYKQSQSKSSTTSTTAQTLKSAGNIDKSVVGSWMMESLVSSGGYGDYASMTSVTYYQYNADGTYCITDGGGAGGGSGWSYSANAKKGATCGKWYVKDGYLYYTKEGQWYYKKYTMHNGQLVFGTSGSYTFLSRAN